VSVAQLALHAAPSEAHVRLPGQAAGVPAAHVPDPLQTLVVRVLPEHVEPQEVVAIGYVQAAVFVPSHAPLQAPTGPPSDPAQTGRAPCGVPPTGQHVPSWSGTSHASHCPVHAWSQQKPSTQLPLAHWSAAVQLLPGSWRNAHEWAAVQ
jgi:hypothetical protein